MWASGGRTITDELVHVEVDVGGVAGLLGGYNRPGWVTPTYDWCQSTLPLMHHADTDAATRRQPRNDSRTDAAWSAADAVRSAAC